MAFEGELELVIQARSGERQAWDDLFRHYQKPLFAYVLHLVQNEATALDIIQDTFVSALKWIGQLKEPGKFGNWLYRIAHQKCVQIWRRSGREVEWTDTGDERESADPVPLEQIIQEERVQELFAALARLPETARSVLLLHYLQDCSLQEIAEITSTEMGTVKSRLHYARKQLRQLMESTHAETNS